MQCVVSVDYELRFPKIPDFSELEGVVAARVIWVRLLQGMPSAMNLEQQSKEAGQEIRDEAETALANAQKKSAEIYRTVKSKGGDAAACADEFIRSKPLPVVAGALVFGLAVGYFAATRRMPPSLAQQLRGHFDDATSRAGDLIPSNLMDSVSSNFGRFTNNLKFW